MEKVFKNSSIEKFLSSLNELENPNLIKTKLAEFIVTTFDGTNFMLKTKITDEGKLLTDELEKIEFITRILSHCEVVQEYELCADLLLIKNKLSNNETLS